MPAPSEVSPFFGTAPYYDRFRAPYPKGAIDCIVERFNLNKDTPALDLGCGPGTIAIPLSCFVSQIVAVDPDAGMIAEGQHLAASQNRRNIQWLQSSAEEISLGAQQFQVVTIGQAFHWMNRDRVLQNLAALIANGGGLALVNPGRRRPQESWEPVADRVVTGFLGPQSRHPKSNPQEPQNEPALLRSKYFSNFTAHEFPSTIMRNIDSVIGCIYSKSNSTMPLFGHKAREFEAELTKVLLSLNPDGVFNEQIETEVLIAPKCSRLTSG